MLKAESRLAKNIFEAYGSNAQNMQIVHHMMDMQYAYAPHQSDKELKIVAPMYDFPSVQLRRMQKIQQNSKGKILGFAAFDPRRSDCIDVVKWACSMQFLGFKFYPAMGYKPIGNNDPSVEKNVNEFFKYCEEKGIPVFTHCTPLGFETKEKLGLNTNPDHWAKLLERYPRLNLCFGHGGGGYAVRKSKGKNGKESKTIYHGWTAKDVGEWEADNNFARKVSILCKKYENVYCELAYITELFEGKEKQQNASREALIENLQRAIEKPSSEEIYDFSLKVAYGSDWHMPSMVNHPRKYLEVFLDIFKQQNPKLKINQEDFFWKNAYKYLNLT